MTESRYRWVIVAAGGLLCCVAIGSMFSLPVLLQPIARDTGWSVTGVSSAMTIGFLAMAVGSMAWGSLSDRFGPRAIEIGRADVCSSDLIARDTGWSVTGVSSAMTIGFLAMAVGSMAWGSLSDRFGPRAI